MPDGLLKRVDAAFRPALFVNHYGSSEIYTFTTEPRAAAKPGSAGTAGLNQRIRIIKFGTDSPDARAATGEEGQIIADGASDEATQRRRWNAWADAAELIIAGTGLNGLDRKDASGAILHVRSRPN